MIGNRPQPQQLVASEKHKSLRLVIESWCSEMPRLHQIDNWRLSKHKDNAATIIARRLPSFVDGPLPSEEIDSNSDGEKFDSRKGWGLPPRNGLARVDDNSRSESLPPPTRLRRVALNYFISYDRSLSFFPRQ